MKEEIQKLSTLQGILTVRDDIYDEISANDDPNFGTQLFDDQISRILGSESSQFLFQGSREDLELLISSLYLKIYDIYLTIRTNFFNISNIRFRNLNITIPIEDYFVETDVFYHQITNDFNLSPFFTINENKIAANSQAGIKVRMLRSGYQMFYKRFKVASIVLSLNFSRIIDMSGNDPNAVRQLSENENFLDINPSEGNFRIVFNIKASGIEDLNEILTFQNFLKKIFDYIQNNRETVRNMYSIILGNSWVPSIFSSNSEKDRYASQVRNQYQMKNNLQQLKAFKDDLFIPGYSNTCQNKPSLLSVSTDEEAKEFALRTGYEVLRFAFPIYHEDLLSGETPTETDLVGWGHAYLYCPHRKAPYPGVMFNNIPNSAKYPIIPCCYQSSHAIPKKNRPIKSVLAQWLAGNQYIYWGGKKSLKYTNRVLEPEHEAYLPMQITEWLQRSTNYLPSSKVSSNELSQNPNIGDFVRVGVPVSSSSFLSAILTALGNAIDPRYKSIDVELYRRYLFETGGKIIRDFNLPLEEEVLEEDFQEIPSIPTIDRISKTYPEVGKQQLFDFDNSEIRSLTTDNDQALDSRLHLRILEEHFGINIIVMSNLGLYSNSNDVSSIEVPRHNMFYERNIRRDRYNVILFKHSGTQSDNLKYPHYELITLKKYSSMLNGYQYFAAFRDRQGMFLDSYEDTLKQLLNNKIWLKDVSTGQFKVSDEFWTTSLLQMIREFTILSQGIDSMGFTRTVNLEEDSGIQFSLVTPPIEPFNVPQIHSLGESSILDNIEIIHQILVPKFGNPISKSYSTTIDISPGKVLKNVAGIYFSMAGGPTSSDLESLFCPVSDRLIQEIDNTYDIESIVSSRLPIITSTKSISVERNYIQSIENVLEQYSFNSNVEKYQYFKRQRIKLMAFFCHLYEVIAYENDFSDYTPMNDRLLESERITSLIRVVNEGELKNLLTDTQSEVSHLISPLEPSEGAFDSKYSIYLYDLERVPTKIPPMDFEQDIRWFADQKEFLFVRYFNTEPIIIATSYHLKEAWIQFLQKFVQFGRRAGIQPRDTINIGFFGRPFEGTQSQIRSIEFQDTEVYESQSQLVQWKSMQESISKRYMVSRAIHLRFFFSTDTVIFHWSEIDRYFLFQSPSKNSGNEGMRRCILIALYWYLYGINLGSTVDNILEPFYNPSLKRTLEDDIIRDYQRSKLSNVQKRVINVALDYNIFNPQYFYESTPGEYTNYPISLNLYGLTVRYVPNIQTSDFPIKIIVGNNFFGTLLNLN